MRPKAGWIKFLTGRIFMTKVFVALVFGFLLVAHEGWEEKSILVAEALYVLGVALVAACIVGRAWGLSYISGSKNTKLIMTGPFSLSRNPLYFSNFLGAVGLALCSGTITVTLIVGITFALYYPRTIDGEEEKLKELFGEEFEEYRSRVPRFFPKFGGLVEEEEVVIGMHSFSRGIRELGAIVLGIGLMEVIHTLHTVGVLPNLFTIY